MGLSGVSRFMILVWLFSVVRGMLLLMILLNVKMLGR